MYLRSRSLQRTLLRTVLLALILFSSLEALHVRRYIAAARDAAREQERGYEEQGKKYSEIGRVFITGIFWNNEGVLRETIGPALIQLTAKLGEENVFVSLHESGSWDGTKSVLGELDAELKKRGVGRRISVSNATHEDVLAAEDKSSGWITTPAGTQEFRRIPFLAKERNVALEPLTELAAKGQEFDKVLFINDVVFSAYDALTLLSTNGGSYAAACAMDFKDPPAFYDTFALRDINGEEHLMPTWPYFRAKASREAAIRGVPVPVRSCWNGMVAMAASPFTSPSPSPLLFRGLPDSLAQSHLEASECCLIHADNPLSSTHGVFVNPRVRVAYSQAAYDAAREGEAGLSSLGISARLWENRVRRWSSTTRIKGGMVGRRVGRWERGERGRRERGGWCVINEMQVLRGKGWAHV